jgi:hypothetical protein
LNGRGYATGASGPSTYQYYLNSTNAWTSITSNGNGVANARWSQGGFIFGFMADAATTSVSKYNDASNAWAASASSIVGRGRTAITHRGRGLLAGNASNVTSAEFYNDDGNFWQLTASLVVGCTYFQPFSLQNASYAAAGWNGAPVLSTQRFSSSVKSAVLGLALEVK